MADYYTQATVSLPLKLDAFSKQVLSSLASQTIDGPHRLIVEAMREIDPEQFNDMDLSGDDFEYSNSPLGLSFSFDHVDGTYYFYAEEQLTDLAVLFLQWLLKRECNADEPYVCVEGAMTCSKMRPDGFGGIAVFITRTHISWMSTTDWIDEQKSEYRTKQGETNVG